MHPDSCMDLLSATIGFWRSSRLFKSTLCYEVFNCILGLSPGTGEALSSRFRILWDQGRLSGASHAWRCSTELLSCWNPQGEDSHAVCLHFMVDNVSFPEICPVTFFLSSIMVFALTVPVPALQWWQPLTPRWMGIQHRGTSIAHQGKESPLFLQRSWSTSPKPWGTQSFGGLRIPFSLGLLWNSSYNHDFSSTFCQEMLA